jgi:integrase/recombinase XerD
MAELPPPNRRPTMSNQHSSYTGSNQLVGATNKAPKPYGIEDIRYFVDVYVLHHKSQQHSPKTISTCIDRLGKFVWFLQHKGYPLTLEEITPAHIRAFFVYLHEQSHERWGSSNHSANKPISQSTANAYGRVLRAFFRWVSEEVDIRNPFSNIKLPRVPNTWQIEVLDDEQIAALFKACDQTDTPFMAARNRTILAILLDTGARSCELLGLEVGDIDPQQGLFMVHGKGGKVRPIVIGTFARRELWSYLAHHRNKLNTPYDALFTNPKGEPLTYSGLSQMFQRLKARTGIANARAHVCRHTAATSLYRNGMRGPTLQAIMGHSNFNTTKRFYLGIAPGDLEAEHRGASPLDKLSKPAGLGGNRLLSAEARTLRGHTGKKPLPSPQKLLHEVQQSNYRAVAKRYGCSDTWIRKTLTRAGLLG